MIIDYTVKICYPRCDNSVCTYSKGKYNSGVVLVSSVNLENYCDKKLIKLEN